ncbi:MAG: hypothetical protein JO357_11600, partial [Hyphomicrobiales bacterium]|nr:hypothetical protein [Hyphomicrobiales bacterium]
MRLNRREPARPTSSCLDHRVRYWLAGTALALLSAAPAFATDFSVSDDASLRAALTNAVAGDSITFKNNIAIASDLPAIT